jgi:hypothetical protein
MRHDYYEWRVPKGRLSIERSDQYPGCWDLCLNGIPIRQGYTDPDQAAVDASSAELGDESRNRILRGMHVPWELKQWSTFQEPRSDRSNQNNN